MKAIQQRIKIKELVQNYQNNDEEGVFGYSGKLNIRPAYQREFVYKDKQQEAVIETINKNFPLNTMYWAANDDNTFGLVDGQQRTMSICQYVSGNFAVNFKYFHNLTKEEQDKFLDYELMVYVCEGTTKDKLDWFKTINIAGIKLTDQELLNAQYTGYWLADAKRHFSKTNCPAYLIGSNYLTGSPIRQDYLETTLGWISGRNIEQYMAEHQHDPNANELWLYYQSVINWVKVTFPVYRKEMKGLDWGYLYNTFKEVNVNSKEFEEVINQLMQDEDVTNKKGIYYYMLDGKEKHLNIRAFSPNQKREAYERQGGRCAISGKEMPIEEMEADHVVPWHSGGKTSLDNCQMISKEANREKGGK